jgi:hypothetical protein
LPTLRARCALTRQVAVECQPGGRPPEPPEWPASSGVVLRAPLVIPLTR